MRGNLNCRSEWTQAVVIYHSTTYITEYGDAEDRDVMGKYATVPRRSPVGATMVGTIVRG